MTAGKWMNAAHSTTLFPPMDVPGNQEKEERDNNQVTGIATTGNRDKVAPMPRSGLVQYLIIS